MKKVIIIVLFTFLSLIYYPAFSQLFFSSSNLPLVFIDTYGQAIIDEPKIDATMGIIYHGDNQPAGINDQHNNYNGQIGIEIRGTSSQSFPKKQYGFETRTTEGENLNVPLMGFPKENDWILHAPYSDKTLIRNVFSAYLFREMGHYAPRMKLCEMFLNNEYQGVYILIEKIKRDKNRVNIAKMLSEDNPGYDISGGYLLQIDRWEGDCFWRTSKGGVIIGVEYPKCEDLTPSQFQYIKNEIALFESALFPGRNSKPDKAYLNHIDLNSFVDFFIVNEISKNVDGYILSTFLYKNKNSNDEKIKMGPVWDFNIAYGNANYREGYLSEGFIYETNKAAWWCQLMQDTSFVNQLHKRWFELRNDILMKENIYNIIDSLTNHLDEAQKRNFKRWPVLGKEVWPNYYVGKKYGDEIDYLKQWFNKRIDWMDENIPGESSFKKPIEIIKAKVVHQHFSNNITIDLELIEESDADVFVYDLTGRIVYKENLKNLSSGHSKINLSLYDISIKSRNMYIINVYINKKSVLQQRLLL
jgi:hypothetical protein